MSAKTIVVSIAGALLFCGCAKPVDPAYLSEIEKAAASVCDCVTVPQERRIECHGKAKSVHPSTTPTGEPPGTYEMGLDEESKHRIEVIRAMANSCEAELLRG